MPPRPELIAHRAGNDPATLAQAAAVADTVELDVHRWRGVLEVRHAKRLWPSQRLWERWHWLPRHTTVPDLAAILAGSDDRARLWFDLKGVGPGLPRAVAAATAGCRPCTVSTKAWWLLRRFATVDGVRTVRSAGNRLELFLLLRVPSRRSLDGVVVHERLLDRAMVARLRTRAPLVFSWAADRRDRVEELVTWGVDGVILDDLALLAELAAARGPAAEP